MADRERPALVHLFEVAAAVMGLDEGSHRLELCFENGYLRRWFSHSGPNATAELGSVDESRLASALKAEILNRPPGDRPAIPHS